MTDNIMIDQEIVKRAGQVDSLTSLNQLESPEMDVIHPLSSTESGGELGCLARDVSGKILDHLNLLSLPHITLKGQQKFHRSLRNPVRIKNLEKVRAHLQVLQDFLDNPEIIITTESKEILTGIMQAFTAPELMSFDSVWEQADLLEGELLRISDPQYIRNLWLTWPRERVPAGLLETIAAADRQIDQPETVNSLIRPYLIKNHRDLDQEYRRDRAMIALRKNYLDIMSLILLGLDFFFCLIYLLIPREEGASLMILLLVIVAGAIGSVLARASKLSRQVLPSGFSDKGREIPLGVRSLLSNGSVFFAQVSLGVTAALISFLILSSKIISFEGLPGQSPEILAVIGFLAGFSEPFFIDIVGKVTQRLA